MRGNLWNVVNRGILSAHEGLTRCFMREHRLHSARLLIPEDARCRPLVQSMCTARHGINSTELLLHSSSLVDGLTD